MMKQRLRAKAKMNRVLIAGAVPCLMTMFLSIPIAQLRILALKAMMRRKAVNFPTFCEIAFSEGFRLRFYTFRYAFRAYFRVNLFPASFF